MRESMSTTKRELLSRIIACREVLDSLIKAHIGHPDQEVRDVIGEAIEAIGRLDGKPIHDI